MIRIFRPTSILLLAALPLALLSCNRSGLGIFYSLTLEEPYADTSLDNELNVRRFLYTTDGGVPQTYFTHAGPLYVRSADASSEWAEAVPGPDGAGTEFVASAGYGSGGVYLVLSSVDADASTLHSFTPDANGSWTNGTLSDAIDIDGDGAASEHVTSIVEAETDLVVNVRIDRYEYHVYRSTDGGESFNSIFTGTEPAQETVEFGSSTLLLTAAALHTEKSGSFVEVTGENTPSGESELSELADMLDAGSLLGALFVLAADGTLYTNNGTEWLPPVELLEGLNADSTTRLAVLDGGDGSTVLLLIGTDSGYLEAALSGPDVTAEELGGMTVQVPGTGSPTTAGTDYAVVELGSSRVTDIDVAADLIFIGTAAAGLWRNQYPSDDPPWSRE